MNPPNNPDGMNYANKLIENIINFFDDKINEYIDDKYYELDLKAWLIPINAIYFVGDNFQETIENQSNFKLLQDMCKTKKLRLSIYPHLPDDKYKKEVSIWAPSIFRYSLYFEKIPE